MPARKVQSGVALIMVLIMLTAMAIAGVALVRVVDSANVISGNFAFRQSTLNIADLGIEAAAAELVTIRAVSSEQAYRATSCTDPIICTCTANDRNYFPARSIGNMLDAKGLPILGNTGAGTQAISWACNDVPAAPRGYAIRYVIDRQCEAPIPVTDTLEQCSTDTPMAGGSKKGGGTVFSTAGTIFYRVTVQVTGPRNTQSHVQVFLGY